MPKALVILSGGQDSTTCAALARVHFEEVHAITFNYGQRHAIEIDSAIAVASALGLDSHEVIDLGAGILKSSSPLISLNELGKYDSIESLPSGVEPTFVPGRNILFLTIAANRAAAFGCTDIFIGVCEEDFGGYWDCRQDFITQMETAIGLGIHGSPEFKIHTPLMKLSKADSVRLAVEVLGDNFDRVMGLTHTCYDGVKGGCGECHACHLRDRGFKDAGIVDPLWKIRSNQELKDVRN